MFNCDQIDKDIFRKRQFLLALGSGDSNLQVRKAYKITSPR